MLPLKHFYFQAQLAEATIYKLLYFCFALCYVIIVSHDRVSRIKDVFAQHLYFYLYLNEFVCPIIVTINKVLKILLRTNLLRLTGCCVIRIILITDDCWEGCLPLLELTNFCFRYKSRILIRLVL